MLVKNLSLKKSYHFSCCIKVDFFGCWGQICQFIRDWAVWVLFLPKGPKVGDRNIQNLPNTLTQLSLFPFYFFNFNFLLFSRVPSSSFHQTKWICGSTVGQTGTKWKWKLPWALWIHKLLKCPYRTICYFQENSMWC